MKGIAFLLVGLLLSGCATIEKMIAQQKRLSEAVENKTYDLSLAELELKVVDYFSGWRTVTPDEAAQKIKTDIDEGFVYKGKYYQKYQPDLLELFDVLTSQDKEYMNDYFTRANYHTLEKSERQFIFVFDGLVFEGTKVNDKQSKINVYAFQKIKHGPYKLDVDFLALITKYGSLLSLRKGPVLLEESRAYSYRDRMTEIDLFKKIDPQNYEKVSLGI